MSAILKALQKLEADTHSFQAWKINVRTAGGKARRLKGLLIFGAMASLALLAYAGGIIHIRMPTGDVYSRVSSVFHMYLSQPHEKVAQPVSRQKPVVTSPPTQKLKVSPKAQAVAPKKRLNQSEESTRGAQAPRFVRPLPKEPGKDSPVAVDSVKPVQKKPDLNAAQSSPKQIARSRSLNSVVHQPSVKKEPPPSPMPTDPSITLQAIAWAEAPQSRMAVINGQILREGESLEGIIVDRIKEDRVIVRKGAETMILLFRNK